MARRTMTMTGVSAGLALLLLMLLSAATLADAPKVLYVAPGAACGGATPCYATLQEAVDAAHDGDEIKVAGGVYDQAQTRDAVKQIVYLD